MPLSDGTESDVSRALAISGSAVVRAVGSVVTADFDSKANDVRNWVRAATHARITFTGAASGM